MPTTVIDGNAHSFSMLYGSAQLTKAAGRRAGKAHYEGLALLGEQGNPTCVDLLLKMAALSHCLPPFYNQQLCVRSSRDCASLF